MAIFEVSLLLSDRRNFIFLLTTDVSKSFFKLILNYAFYFSFVIYTLIVFFDTLYVLLTVNIRVVCVRRRIFKYLKKKLKMRIFVNNLVVKDTNGIIRNTKKFYSNLFRRRVIDE